MGDERHAPLTTLNPCCRRQEREAEREAVGDERHASFKRAVAFLQQQAADGKSGGQGGMWKKNKKSRH